MNISLENLSLTLDSKKIMDSLSFNFEENNFYIIKGESGCGKTTLLKCISTLQNHDSGNISYSEELPILQLRRKIQYLPQLPVIFDGSVKDNLLKPFSFKPFDQSVPEDDELQKKLGVLFSDVPELEKKASKLSQGEKQRLALCRTLMVQPQVLLCDEPTASLDSDSRKIVEEKIVEFAKVKGNMVIFISHHAELLVDHAFISLQMKHGKLEVVS